MKYKLYNDCCLNILKTMASSSVDLVVTSPPYNMNLRIRNGKYCSRQIVKELSTKYTAFPDNLPLDDYFDFNRKALTECLRVSDLVFYNVQLVTGNKPALMRLLGEFSNKLKEIIVWDKVNSQPAIGQKVMNSQYEFIWVFQNSKPEARSFDCATFDRGTLSNVWSIKREHKRSSTHGATFPSALVEKILSNFTQKNNTILDPFMGTGTAGIVAAEMDREFIGIEIDSNYFALARAAIEKVYS